MPIFTLHIFTGFFAVKLNEPVHEKTNNLGF